MGPKSPHSTVFPKTMAETTGKADLLRRNMRRWGRRVLGDPGWLRAPREPVVCSRVGRVRTGHPEVLGRQGQKMQPFLRGRSRRLQMRPSWGRRPSRGRGFAPPARTAGGAGRRG